MNIQLKHIFIFLTASSLLTISQLSSVHVIIATEEGESIFFDVDPNDSINDLIEANVKQSSLNEIMQPRFQDHRDYYAPTSEAALKDMRFIISTLGNEPLLKLKQHKKNLTEAGDRLNNVHPLNFWKEIFSDEKMTSAFHNIKRRSKVWKSFIKGMGKSLQEAVDGDNLKDEYIQDFASKVNIDVNHIKDSLQKCDWSEFAKQLLTHVPRHGNADRYDQ